MIRLIKSLTITLGQEFRKQLHTNFVRIEDFLNKSTDNFEKHKTEDLNAHNSKQISDDKFGTVEQGLNVINNRYNNLVISKGKNSLQEVKDARVDNEGTAHATLFERLQSDNTRFELNKDEVMSTVVDAKEQVLAQEFSFDIPNQSWQYLTNLSPYTNAVMQSFHIDNKTGLIYMTQAYGDGYKLTKMKSNGMILSQMQVNGGGHGTHNGYRWSEDGSKFWIYSHMKRPDGFNSLVRFTYRPDETITYGDYDMEEVKTFHSERPYITPVINQHENRILFRIEYPKSEWNTHNAMNYVEVRDLNDVDNNIDKVLYTMPIPNSHTNPSIGQPMQGIAFDEETLYWYTGDSDPAVPNFVTAYNMKTKKQLYQKQADVGGLGKNGPEGNFSEAEGMQLYKDEGTGKKALLIGVSTGAGNYRSHEIHGIFMRDVYDKLTAAATPVSMTETGGRTKTYPVENFVKIADIMEPGHYYMTTATTMNLTDFPLPKEMRDAGWFLEVSAPNVAGDVKQTLTRNSYVRDLMKFERMVSVNKLSGGSNTTNWNHIKSDSIGGPSEPIPSHISNMNQLGIISNKQWYCDTKRSSEIKDHPRPGVAGWIVDIQNITSSAHKITVTRVTSSAVVEFYIAYFSNTKNERVTPWTRFEGKNI